jgi:hypothetical protein
MASRAARRVLGARRSNEADEWVRTEIDAALKPG